MSEELLHTSKMQVPWGMEMMDGKGGVKVEGVLEKTEIKMKVK